MVFSLYCTTITQRRISGSSDFEEISDSEGFAYRMEHITLIVCRLIVVKHQALGGG